MNARSLILLFSALGFAADVSAADLTNYTPMKIIQNSAPMYPRALSELGVKEGEAHVAIQVDEKGSLLDHLVTYYTNVEFAESAVAALKKWKYEPAWLNGQPRGATVDLTFLFESQGLTVVNLNPSVYVMRRNMDLMPGSYGYRAATLRQLDRIPTPKKVVTPVYPVEAPAGPRAASVTVTFYIDEHGRVRLPAVSRQVAEGDDIFAAAAIGAVSQWEFEPPTARGHPVLVEARQDFNFNPTVIAKKTE